MKNILLIGALMSLSFTLSTILTVVWISPFPKTPVMPLFIAQAGVGLGLGLAFSSRFRAN